LREGLDDAEGHDLALRVVERVDAAQIVHVPRVLCHAGDAVDRGGGESSRRAVSEHLARVGIAADVVQAPEAPAGMQRVRFAVPDPQPQVSIVIPTRDRADLLRACVEAILTRTTYAHYGIVIVDNGSTEESMRELLDQYRAKGITVIRDDAEFNYSALNNRAVAATSAEYVCLLNNDIEVLTPGWLEEMVSMAARPDVGAVGARLWYPDRRVQHAGLVLGIAGIVGYAHKLLLAGEPGYACRAILHQSFSALTAACLLVRKSVYEGVGGLDERLAVAFNDVDFCLRLREAGYRHVWTPYAEMIHTESSSRGPESTPEKARRLQEEIDLFRSRWGAKLQADPAYSPNLTLDAEDFSLAWPPRIEDSPIIGTAMTNTPRTEP
jgi:GT2 family glycosyltransferase